MWKDAPKYFGYYSILVCSASTSVLGLLNLKIFWMNTESFTTRYSSKKSRDSTNLKQMLKQNTLIYAIFHFQNFLLNLKRVNALLMCAAPIPGL